MQSRTSSSSSPDKLPEITIRPGKKRKETVTHKNTFFLVPVVPDFFVPPRDTAREGAPFFDIPPLFKSVSPSRSSGTYPTYISFPYPGRKRLHFVAKCSCAQCAALPSSSAEARQKIPQGRRGRLGSMYCSRAIQNSLFVRWATAQRGWGRRWT